MNRILSLALSLTVLAPAAGLAAGAPAMSEVEMVDSKDLQKALLLSAEGSIVIEADGSVGEYTIATPLTPELMEVLSKSIPRWRFEPVLVDGKPVRAESKMRLSLAAVETGKEYRVAIENVVFPGGMSALDQARASQGAPVQALGRQMNPPVYPRTLERAGVTGRVLLGLHFGPDGRMLDVVAVQSMLFNVRGYNNELRQAVRLLEQSSVEAARKWTVQVKQKPGTTTTERDFTSLTTIEYVLTPTPRPGRPTPASNNAPPGQWRQATRTPKRAMPWLAGLETPEVGVADVVDGEMMPLAGVPKLKTPLAH